MNSKRRVVLVDLGTLGGDLALDMADGLSAESEVTLVVSASSKTIDKFKALANVSVIAIGRSPGLKGLLGVFGIRRQLVRAVRKVDPEFVVDTGLSPWSTVTKYAYRPATLILIVHDPIPHPGLKDRLSHFLGRYRWLTSDVLVTLSAYSASALRKSTNTPIVSGKHGQRHEMLKPDPQSISLRNQKLLFWGRLESYKGIDLLLDAYALAKQSIPNLTLTVVGRGALTADTKSRIEKLSINFDNRWIDDGRIFELLSTHGVLLLPYLSATQSGPAATGLSNGIPVIATDVGALGEQVRHEQTGLIVPPNDPIAFAAAIERIANDRELAKSFSAASFRILEEEERWAKLGPLVLQDVAKVVPARSRIRR